MASAVSCARGSYCGFNASSGYWQQPCAAGRYGNSTQLTSPLCDGPCDAGYFCRAGAVRPNTRLDCFEEAGACERTQLCPAGFTCASGAPPAPCIAGSYCAAGLAAGTTDLCSPGYFCPQNSTSEFGETAFAPGNTTLSPRNACPPGTTNAYKGRADIKGCTPCGLGYYSSVVASDLALCSGQCLPGQRGLAVGQKDVTSACQDCLPGTFAGVPGQAFCTLCPLGSFASNSSSSVCTPCDAGYYGSTTGSTSKDNCMLCP